MRTDIELLLDCGRLWADAASKVGNRAGMIGKLGASSLGTLLRAAASALIGVGLAVSGAGAQDIPIDKLAQSKVFYDIKGGQTYLVPKNSKLGSMAESIQAESTDYDANSDIWGLQPGEPPTGARLAAT